MMTGRPPMASMTGTMARRSLRIGIGGSGTSGESQ